MSIMHKEMFGINETLAKEILEVALSTGGDFAEVYMEKTTNEVLRLHSGKLSTANVSKVKGAAIRIIKGELEVNSSITDCTYENLLKAAKTLAGSFNDKKHVEVQPFVEKKVELVVNPKNVRGNDISREVNLLKTASDTIYAYSKEIVQVICNLTKTEKRIFVFASDSTWQTDYRCNTRLSCQAVASDGKEMETGFDSFGRNQGMEMFDDFDVVPFAKQVAHDAVEMLHATNARWRNASSY